MLFLVEQLYMDTENMKTKTILIAIICIFLLLMIPNVNAIQYNEVNNEIIKQIDNIIKLKQFHKPITNVIPSSFISMLIYYILLFIGIAFIMPYYIIWITMINLGINWLPGWNFSKILLAIGNYILVFIGYSHEPDI